MTKIRPISRLPHVETFLTDSTSEIEWRRILEENQPKEKAGYSQGFSTKINVMNSTYLFASDTLTP